MSDENEEVAMAECGSCRAIVPVDSESCPECGISFSGVSDEALGECGAAMHWSHSTPQNVRNVVLFSSPMMSSTSFEHGWQTTKWMSKHCLVDLTQTTTT